MFYSFYYDYLEGFFFFYEFILNIIFFCIISRFFVKKEDFNNSQRYLYIFKNYFYDVYLIMNNLNVLMLISFLEFIVFFEVESVCFEIVIYNKEEE